MDGWMDGWMDGIYITGCFESETKSGTVDFPKLVTDVGNQKFFFFLTSPFSLRGMGEVSMFVSDVYHCFQHPNVFPRHFGTRWLSYSVSLCIQKLKSMVWGTLHHFA